MKAIGAKSLELIFQNPHEETIISVREDFRKLGKIFRGNYFDGVTICFPNNF